MKTLRHSLLKSKCKLYLNAVMFFSLLERTEKHSNLISGTFSKLYLIFENLWNNIAKAPRGFRDETVRC
jgi:hypothetical protein